MFTPPSWTRWPAAQRSSQATPKSSTADFQAEAVIDGIICVGTIGSSVHDYDLAIRNGPSGTLYSGATAPNKRPMRPAPLQWADVFLRHGARGQSSPQQNQEDVAMASSREERLFRGFWCRAQVPDAPALTPALLDEWARQKGLSVCRA